MFPPRDMDEKYIVLPFFWVPEDTIPRRVKANSVPYDVWEKQGHILATEGNVIHYDFIEKFIYDLAEKYHILEIAVDKIHLKIFARSNQRPLSVTNSTNSIL